jgi:hypothetical protein
MPEIGKQRVKNIAIWQKKENFPFKAILSFRPKEGIQNKFRN